MKVKVTVTVDLDAEAYAEEYGCESDEVREDFRRHAEEVLHQLADV